MKIVVYLLIVFTLLSCCETKKVINPELNNNSSVEINFMEVNVYNRISKERIKDESKKADAPFIYDYEVDETKVKTTKKELKDLKLLVADKTNFLTDSVKVQCTRNPDYFIEIDTKTIYGFHLTTDCPMLFLLSYNEGKESVKKKHILIEKVKLFKDLTKNFSQK